MQTIKTTSSQGEKTRILSDSVTVVIACWTNPPGFADHRDAIRCLQTGTFELVVELRVFVRRKIQLRSLSHDPYADKSSKAIGSQTIEETNRAGRDAVQRRQPELGGNDPPEYVWQGMPAGRCGSDSVDNPARHREHCKWNHRGDYAQRHRRGDHVRSGVPNHAEDRRNIRSAPKRRRQPLLNPCSAATNLRNRFKMKGAEQA